MREVLRYDSPFLSITAEDKLSWEVNAKVPRSKREELFPDYPPTIEPEQAIPLLRQKIEELDEIAKLPFWDSKVKEWEVTTETILDGVFGRYLFGMKTETHEVIYLRTGLERRNMTDDEIQQNHVLRQKKRKVLLERHVMQLEKRISRSRDRYQLHQEIEKVSGKLYRDRHYKQAALEAYICTINAVKKKSGLSDEGDSLMNKAFGFEEGRLPLIQFNSLNSTEEKDEQRGFMFLYKGIVGLRNSKAHSNRLINDPNRAHEYLALASLLQAVLDFAKMSNPSSSA